jgi:LemA protein
MRSLATIGVIVGILLLVLVGGCNSYNSFVTQEEQVENAWSKVESAYQARADLIPNLVNTVKGSAEFERGTLTDVVEARAKATAVNIDPNNLSTENIQRFQEAQGALTSSLSRLLVSVERYPELRTTAAFTQLQSQLEGIENRIRVERNRYNDAATDFNTQIRRFPGAIFASVFGFAQKAQFEAEEGAQQAPEVEF